MPELFRALENASVRCLSTEARGGARPLSDRDQDSAEALVDFDAARYHNDDSIPEYLSAALEANNLDFLLLALSDVVRPRE